MMREAETRSSRSGALPVTSVLRSRTVAIWASRYELDVAGIRARAPTAPTRSPWAERTRASPKQAPAKDGSVAATNS